MKEECGKFGEVLQVHIPRPPAPGAPPPPGLGKILIEYMGALARGGGGEGGPRACTVCAAAGAARARPHVLSRTRG